MTKGYVYKNPWARNGEPREYVRQCPPPQIHCGCQIFHVLPKQWDVVKNGVCITQRAGLKGALAIAELVKDLATPSYEDVREREIFSREGSK